MIFSYVPRQLAEQETQIREMRKLHCPADEEAFALLTQWREVSQHNPAMLNEREIAQLILWAEERGKLKTETELLQAAAVNNTPVLQKHIFGIWQDRFHSEDLSEIGNNLLSNESEKEEWQKQWATLLTVENIPLTLAGIAAAYCSLYDMTFHAYARKFSIRSETELGRRMEMLFFCFCDEKRFACNDETLCSMIRQMRRTERRMLLQNMLRRFPLFTSAGYLLQNQSVYVEQYPLAIKMLAEMLPESPYSVLLQNYLEAAGISDDIHRNYWKNLFLNHHPFKQRLNYFHYLHEASGQLFYVYAGNTLLIDAYQEDTLYIMDLAETAAMGLPTDPHSMCPAEHRYSGKGWMHVAGRIDYEDTHLSRKQKGIHTMEEVKITKLEVAYASENRTSKAIYQNANGINGFELPEFPSRSEMRFTLENGEQHTIIFETFRKICSLDTDKLLPSEREKASFLLNGDTSNFEIGILSSESQNQKPPALTLWDVTETYLLDLKKLTMEIISGKDAGIWGNCGNRLLQFKVDPFPFQDGTPEIELHFLKIGNYELDDPDELFYGTMKQIEKTPNQFLCTIDTDKLQSEVLDDVPKVSLECEFVITYRYMLGALQSETYCIPFSLNINNTKLDIIGNKSTCLDKSARVSIDFGTSSTCAAVRAGKLITMIEMSPDAFNQSSYNVYENPTNLMIYRFDLLQEQWNRLAETQPLLCKAGLEEFAEYSDEVFDFGHRVKNNYAGSKRIMESVISRLKTLPQSEMAGEYVNCIPYHIVEGGVNDIHLTCTPSETSDFNPIAFYSYLLGKAINHPNGENNKFYTRYSLSFPVKFSEENRRKIKDSIAEGIKRSLPRYVRDMEDKHGKPIVRIDMTHSEPVACIGAACGHELRLGANNEPALFAVFDFGGGTLDFSFGMYRKADEDTEGFAEAIELFGTDGAESIGGELLIRKIAYWVFTLDSNRKLLDYDVIFEKPLDEPIPDGYSPYIQSNSQIAKSNTLKISEYFARPYFEGKPIEKGVIEPWNSRDEDGEVNDDGTNLEFQISLFNRNGSEIDELDVAVDTSIIYPKLKMEFEKICKVFEEAADRTFNGLEARQKMEEYGVSYDPKTVQVILTGNTSQHPFVKQLLSEKFSAENVKLIGSADSRQDMGGHYRITPKTAVAIGQLMLQDKLVNELKTTNTQDAFLYYIAVEKEGKTEIIIDKPRRETDWKRVGIFKDGEVQIFYNGILDAEHLESWKYTNLEYDEDDERRMICYLRIKSFNEIEYTAIPLGSGDPNENPSIIEETYIEQLK